jgi:ubiquinone/menaquinone biosynthesis C-methylase UbiE
VKEILDKFNNCYYTQEKATEIRGSRDPWRLTKGIAMSDSEQQKSAQEAADRAKLQQIQRNFGVAAADYVTSKVHASGPDLVWLAETARLTGTEHVLDIATGGGHAAFALAATAADVVALDLTRPMLEVAQKEAEARHLFNIRFLEGDAQAIPCEANSFDVISCRHAPHHFPNIRRAVSEWARVLRPGGRLLLIDSTAPEEEDLQAFLHEIETLRDPSHVRNHPLSAWQTLLQEAGFTLEQASESGTVLDIPSWTQRMRTPADAVARIEQLLRDASPAARERLRIEPLDESFVFVLPTALIAATKPA